MKVLSVKIDLEYKINDQDKEDIFNWFQKELHKEDFAKIKFINNYSMIISGKLEKYNVEDLLIDFEDYINTKKQRKTKKDYFKKLKLYGEYVCDFCNDWKEIMKINDLYICWDCLRRQE